MGGKWITAVVMVFLCFAVDAKCQVNSSGWKEMVAGVPPFDQAHVTNLIPFFNAVSGIDYYGYCEQLGTVLLYFDPSIYNDPQQAIDSLRTHKLTLNLKTNTSFKTIFNYCPDVRDGLEINKE